MATYNVGDSVTVWGPREPQGIRTIARVAGRKVVDDKGDEWLASDGRRWGRASEHWYVGPHIRHTTKGDADRIRISIRRSKLICALDLALREIKACEDAARVDAFYEACLPLRALMKKGEG